jgi:hypothetical protein
VKPGVVCARGVCFLVVFSSWRGIGFDLVGQWKLSATGKV